MQLQVACRQLWETLDPHAHEIGADDVVALGSVDNALGDFYASQVRAVAERTGSNEREIRSWFGEALITENGFRTQVVRGPQTNGEAVVRELENAHLIRTEQRRGTEWYELAHDRLIEPIRANNAAWGQHALGLAPTRGAAMGASRAGPRTLLMTGPRLAEAEGWARQHASEMLPVDRDFLDAGRAEQRRIDLEQRATRLKLVAMTTVSALALAALALVVLFFVSAQRQRARREAQRAADRTRLGADRRLRGRRQRGVRRSLPDRHQRGLRAHLRRLARQADRRRDLRGASNKGRAEAARELY